MPGVVDVVQRRAESQQHRKRASDEPNTLTRMLTNLAAQFGNDTSLEENRYTLSMARTPWQDTLFMDDGSLLLSSY
jgi:hypothetical protein